MFYEYIAGVVKRTFWGLMTVACMVFLVYHLTMSCILYFSHETAVNVALVTRRQLTFPAVTVCNLNPVKQSAVSQSSALSRLVSEDNRKRKKRDTNSAETSFGECITSCFYLEETVFICCYLLNVVVKSDINYDSHRLHTYI